MKLVRKENQPGRNEGDFKPWLSNAEASEIARHLIKQGCKFCGEKSSPALLEGPDGKVFEGQSWSTYQDPETGKERLVCVNCHWECLALRKGCAVCKATPMTPGVKMDGWKFQYDDLTNFAKSVLCPACS